MPRRWRRRAYPKYPDYISAEERRRRLEKERARFATPEAVRVAGRQIAQTFWGQAWCRNLERYSDLANRLPRGRTYVRSGAVLQLSIEPGVVRARVMGTSLYRVTVEILPLPAKRWLAIKQDCAGRIDSVVALLEGKLPPHVMEVVTREGTGLFPAPGEIAFDCTCPDFARLCKHIAALLYGVGVKLDQQPELLFALRGVDHHELVAEAPRLWQSAPSGYRRVEGDLSSIFGVEIAEEDRME